MGNDIQDGDRNFVLNVHTPPLPAPQLVVLRSQGNGTILDDDIKAVVNASPGAVQRPASGNWTLERPGLPVAGEQPGCSGRVRDEQRFGPGRYRLRLKERDVGLPARHDGADGSDHRSLRRRYYPAHVQPRLDGPGERDGEQEQPAAHHLPELGYGYPGRVGTEHISGRGQLRHDLADLHGRDGAGPHGEDLRLHRYGKWFGHSRRRLHGGQGIATFAPGDTSKTFGSPSTATRSTRASPRRCPSASPRPGRAVSASWTDKRPARSSTTT